jgi:hypothetical protein
LGLAEDLPRILADIGELPKIGLGAYQPPFFDFIVAVIEKPSSRHSHCNISLISMLGTSIFPVVWRRWDASGRISSGRFLTIIRQC